jgi:endoglucanase
VRLEDRYFDLIQAAGFDSVRIPVRWSAHAAEEAPYAIDPVFFDRVERAVKLATSHKLHVVLNMHHYDRSFDHPNEHHDRFLALWKQIAERFEDYPASLYFELLNEPHANLDADTWNELATEGIALVRKKNPTRKIVVGPPDWNGVDAMQSLVLPEKDRNLIVTFHYYSPFQFTHQGASWTGTQSNRWLGTTWTGTPAERQAVIADLDRVRAGSLMHRRPIFLGEFGAYGKADLASRVRWTRFVADEAIKRKMSFAYWEFCAGFGIYDSKNSVWIEPLKKALLTNRK